MAINHEHKLASADRERLKMEIVRVMEWIDIQLTLSAHILP